jgi:mono/diheme cytochrome c family protein
VQSFRLTGTGLSKTLVLQFGSSPMPCRTVALIFAVLLVSLLPARSQPAETPAASRPAQKVYIPGIEQFMNVIQSEHAKLWYAGKAANWPLAAYQLAEIKEIMSDLEDLFPTFKSMPFGQMLDAVITGPIAELEKALDAKDAKSFAAGYDQLTAACNACHQATGNGFLVMQHPARGGFPNQDFKPHAQ